MSDTTPTQGTPCWYELGTTDLAAAADFYHAVLGWTVADSGMEGFDYHLATAPDGGMVAGMMSLGDQQDGPPTNWSIYLTVDDCDATVRSFLDRGGAVLQEPADVPGTGRFAIVSDPQGAVLGLMQPAPMEGAPETTPAFDQQTAGHGNWHELMTTDARSAFQFYADLFGWTESQTLEGGDMGPYLIFEHRGTALGGIMGLGDAPSPAWLPYFGTDEVAPAIERITAAGGTVHHGPIEVPGGAFIAVANDPQGAWFALVGPR